MKVGNIIKNPAGEDRKVLEVRTVDKVKEYFVSDNNMGEPNRRGKVVGKWHTQKTLKEKGFKL